MRKDLWSFATINNTKDSEIAAGEVGTWRNEVSIEGRIILDKNLACDQDAVIVSIDIYDRHFVTYENLRAIASRAASPI